MGQGIFRDIQGAKQQPAQGKERRGCSTVILVIALIAVNAEMGRPVPQAIRGWCESTHFIPI